MNSVAPVTVDHQPAELYGRLMAGATGLANSDLFARMLASQATGRSILPAGLGLYPDTYAKMLARHFPGIGRGDVLPRPVWPEARRLTERQDLIELLLDHRAIADQSEVWMAEIVSAACLGGDHLWQDLGLWSRKELSRLMQDNFPHLAAKNDRHMKWKKFLYHEICLHEGIRGCRAPSCQLCTDYGKCFDPAD